MDEGDYDVSGLLSGGNDTNFDIGEFNLGDLGNFNLGDLNLGDLNLGDQTQGLDLNSILEGLKTDRVGGQNLDLESLLKDIGGNNAENNGLDLKALQDLMGGDSSVSNLGIGDLAENAGGAADQSYNPEAILKSIRSGNEAVASGMGPGSVGAEQAVGGENENLTGNQLAEAYGTSGKGSVYQNDNTLSSGVSKNEAIASGNAPGSEGAKALVSGELNDEQTAALTGQNYGGKSANEAVASGNSPGSVGAKALANGNLTSDQIAALTGQNSGLTSLLTSTGKSKNEAVASGNTPGSVGAKALVDQDLTPEQKAATTGVVTKGSVYDPITETDKAADKVLTETNKKISEDALKKAANKVVAPGTKSTSGGNMNQLMMLMALMALMNKGGGGGGSSGATIPSLSADRKQLPYGGGASNYRPGQGGVSYFTPTTYTTKAAGGGLMSLNGGGHLGGYSDGGRLLRGPGDGVSDSIPASIGGKQPARLATGEFVVPARIVSELGNGSTDSGAQRLYEMMDRVQHARRKTKNVAADTKAAKYLPA